jgi:hypothetical protein
LESELQTVHLSSSQVLLPPTSWETYSHFLNFVDINRA